MCVCVYMYICVYVIKTSLPLSLSPSLSQFLSPSLYLSISLSLYLSISLSLYLSIDLSIGLSIFMYTCCVNVQCGHTQTYPSVFTFLRDLHLLHIFSCLCVSGFLLCYYTAGDERSIHQTPTCRLDAKSTGKYWESLNPRQPRPYYMHFP